MHKSPIKFDPFTISLTGVNLIEASAGTGKTYGIISICVRLIVLENKNIQEILVSTFTKAAVAELKQRLRNRLVEITNMLERPEVPPGDSFMLELHQQIQARNKHIPDIIQHLKKQLKHFDEASIETIHSFCLGILKDESLLSGAPLHINQVPDHKRAIKTFIDDFFRENIVPSNQNSWLCVTENITPETLYKDIVSGLQKPVINKNVLSDDQKTRIQQIILALQKALNTVSQQLNHDAAKEFVTILDTEPCPLNKNKFRLPTYKSLFKILKQSPEIIFDALKQEKFYKACGKLKFKVGYLKKEYSNDTNNIEVLFESFEPLINLAQIYQDYQDNKNIIITNWQLRLIDYVYHCLENYKKATLERSYDDLLRDVLVVLQSHTQNSQQLISNINKQYHYVLIDEFQDTDPNQYDIFQLLFMQSSTPIFFIGDPKQAIYQFRGADISTYLKAKEKTTNFYTMDTNYRSVTPLVTAVNALFSQHTNPFKIEDIHYYPVKASRGSANIVDHRHQAAALTIIKLNDERQNKDELNKIASTATANYIAQLLNDAQDGRVQYQNRALEAKDIAILVATHEQATSIARSLLKKNIRSVKLEKISIFTTHEATTLLTLLKVSYKIRYFSEESNGNYHSKLNYLLSSDLWGATADEIYTIQNSENKMQIYIEQLRKFFNLWDKKGIYTAFQFLSQQIGFETKWIEQQKERTITNFNQLIELLAEQEIRTHSPYALIQWLTQQMQSHDDTLERYTLRLESDENLVKIITIHASKGLQYPVVFCPFLWDCQTKSTQSQKQASSSHISDTETATKKWEDVEDSSNGTAEEEMRKLYVALTRAEEKLVILRGQLKSNKDHPLEYLIGASKSSSDEIIWDNWINWYQCNPELKKIVDLQETLPQENYFKPTSIDDNSLITITNPNFQHALAEYTSYSKLIRGFNSPISPDYTDTEPHQTTIGTNSVPLDIFSFPKGTTIGNFWHQILESIDLGTPLSEQTPLIRQKVIQHQIHKNYTIDELTKVTLTMLDQVVCAPLNPTITLKTFSSHNLSRELEFMLYQTQAFQLPKINQWLQQSGWESFMIAIPDTNPDKIYETYLSGFIDWVGLNQTELYIIDYKSNFLGNSLNDYHPRRLLIEIHKHYYQIQATIYTLAMYRYFKLIEHPIEQFHIRYLFLRGLQKDSDNGIWKWDINAKQMENLDRILKQNST